MPGALIPDLGDTCVGGLGTGTSSGTFCLSSTWGQAEDEPGTVLTRADFPGPRPETD